MKEEIPEHQKIHVLDISFKGTPMHWWVMHCAEVETWSQVLELLCTRFIVDKEYFSTCFKGMADPKVHLILCETWWIEW